MRLTLICEELLLEDKKEYILNNQGDKILIAYDQDTLAKRKYKFEKAEDVIDVLLKADPTQNQTYLQWIVNQYNKHLFRLEDVETIKSELEDFIRIKQKLDKKDINQYTLNDLRLELEKFKDVEVKSNKQQDRDLVAQYIKDGEAELVYRDSDIIVVIPHTAEAADYYGRGTKWCTSGTNGAKTFCNYWRSGDLIIFMLKNGKKYQIHHDSNQYMDAQDNEINFYNVILKTHKNLLTDERFYEKVLKNTEFEKYYKNDIKALELDTFDECIKHIYALNKKMRNAAETDALEKQVVVSFTKAIELLSTVKEIDDLQECTNKCYLLDDDYVDPIKYYKRIFERSCKIYAQAGEEVSMRKVLTFISDELDYFDNLDFTYDEKYFTSHFKAVYENFKENKVFNKNLKHVISSGLYFSLTGKEMTLADMLEISDESTYDDNEISFYDLYLKNKKRLSKDDITEFVENNHRTTIYTFSDDEGFLFSKYLENKSEDEIVEYLTTVFNRTTITSQVTDKNIIALAKILNLDAKNNVDNGYNKNETKFKITPTIAERFVRMSQKKYKKLKISDLFIKFANPKENFCNLKNDYPDIYKHFNDIATQYKKKG